MKQRNFRSLAIVAGLALAASSAYAQVKIAYIDPLSGPFANVGEAGLKGFKEAADILGGSLPDISQQTLKAVRAEFDRWQSQGLPTGDTVSLSSPAQASSDIKK